MHKIGDRVQVEPNGSWGSVIDIIPGNEYREEFYLVKFDPVPGVEAITLTPSPDRSWIDASRIRNNYRIVELNPDAVVVEHRLDDDQWSQAITFSGLFPQRAAEQWIMQRKGT